MTNDNSIVLAVAIGITVVFRQWKQKPDASLPTRIVHAILPALVSGAAAFAASYAVHSFNASNNKEEALNKIVQQTESTPLIGAILQDEPQYKQELREAVQSNTGAGRALITELRNRYAKPAVWAAPDDVVMTALEQSAHVRDHLAKQSHRLCSEYMMTGIQNLDDLTPEGKQVFNDNLKAMERVYQEGKGQSPRAVPLTKEQTDAVYQMMEFTPAETQALNNNGSDEMRCEAGAKIYAVINKLKPQYKAVWARSLLSQ